MLWVFQKSPKIARPNHPQLPYLPKTMNEKKRKQLRILNLSLFRFPDSELQDFPNCSMRSTSWAQDTQGNKLKQPFTRYEKYGLNHTLICPNKEPRQIIHKKQRENHRYQSAPNGEKEPKTAWKHGKMKRKFRVLLMGTYSNLVMFLLCTYITKPPNQTSAYDLGLHWM